MRSADMSIGDKLKRARIRKKLTIAEVEESTHIRGRFLTALEADAWSELPSAVYGRGYLEQYALFLELPVDELMCQYDKARSTYDFSSKGSQVSFSPKNSIRIQRLLVTPSMAAAILVCCTLVGAAFTVASQVSAFSSVPALNLEFANQQRGEQGELLAVAAGESFAFKGSTVPGSHVVVNGAAVQVKEDGAFEASPSLYPGINAVVVSVTAPNGRKNNETFAVRVP